MRLVILSLILGVLTALLSCSTPVKGRSFVLLEEVENQAVYREDISTSPKGDSPRVEFYWSKPEGKGPWPALIFVHGHQEPQRPGGREYVSKGLVRKFAKKGIFTAAISLPGYGKSEGAPDFGGSPSQQAILATVDHLKKQGLIRSDRVALWGQGRGATASGLAATLEPFAGVILLSPIFEPIKVYEEFKESGEDNLQKLASTIEEEIGTSEEAFKTRSLLAHASEIKGPVVVVVGGKDIYTDPKRSSEFAQAITSSGGWAQVFNFAEYSEFIPIDERNEKILPFINQVLYRP